MRNSTRAISIGCAQCRRRCVFRDQVFLCHATPANDEIYWLETVTPDGTVRMASLEAIEKAAEGITQSLILCGHTHIARAVRLA